MANKISVSEVIEINGFNNEIEFITEIAFHSSVPACCSEGCIVEPDGVCEHGFNSVLIECGMI